MAVIHGTSACPNASKIQLLISRGTKMAARERRKLALWKLARQPSTSTEASSAQWRRSQAFEQSDAISVSFIYNSANLWCGSWHSCHEGNVEIYRTYFHLFSMHLDIKLLMHSVVIICTIDLVPFYYEPCFGDFQEGNQHKTVHGRGHPQIRLNHVLPWLASE